MENFKDIRPNPPGFGKEQASLVLPSSNSFQENVKQFALHYLRIIEPGHGLFLDFSKTPEYKEPVIQYLVQKFGWTREADSFIRKPKS